MKLAQRVGTELRLWELEIWKLYQSGVDPKEAVRQAYKKHPVFDYVRENIKAELPTAARKGYGEGDFPEEAAEALAEIPWSKDGLNLSQRTTKGSLRVVAAVGESLEESIRQCRSVTAAAMDIFDGYSKGGIIPEQDIPKFMEKLLKVAPAREYGGTEYKAALRSAQRNLGKLTTRSMKAAYNQVIEAIESGNEERVQKSINVAVQEKTRYFAERIARTEMSRAYFDGFLAKYADDPDIAAFRVKLSTRHPEKDICDLYANADMFGMGKGIFPKNRLPDYPFHPNCMCRWEPIVVGSRKLKSETPKPQIEEGVNAYLHKLSNGSRSQILGVNGAKDYAKTGEWKENLLNWKEPKLQESRLAGLGANNEPGDASKINVAEFVKKIDVKDTLKTLEQYERENVSLPFEVAVVVCRNGDVYKIKGEADTVNFGVLGKEKLKGASVTHNHPEAYTMCSFSGLDIGEFFEYELELLRGVDEHYVYEIKANSGTIYGEKEKIMFSFTHSYFREVLAKNRIPDSWKLAIDIDTEGFHEVVKMIAKEYHFDYWRKKK